MFFFGKGGQASDLKAGDEVELDIVGAEHREVYVTDVLEADKKTIRLMIPHKGQDLVREFQAGMTVTVQYEQGEKLVSFQTKVIETEENESPPWLILAQP